VPTNDIRIAAASANEGARVVTYDAHFAAVARVGSHIPGAVSSSDRRMPVHRA